MYKYILKRIILSIISLMIIFTIVFFLLQLVDRIPTAIEDEIAIKKQGAKGFENQIRNQVYKSYNFHPEYNAFKQFGIYLAQIFQDGNFGYYYRIPTQTIQSQFAQPFKYTFGVVGIAFMLGSLLGIIFGILAGYKRGKIADIALNFIAILFVSIPSFVLAAIIVFLGTNKNWPIEFLTIEKAGGIWNMIRTLFFPIIIITITSFATLTYYIRNEVVEVLTSDYITSARSKGLSEWKIFRKHLLRNISIPMVSIILPRFIFVIMGSFIIERFFKIPGTAQMFAHAVTDYESNVIMFSVIFFTSLKLGINIIVDILYTILDPRIKYVNKTQKSFYNKLTNYWKRTIKK